MRGRIRGLQSYKSYQSRPLHDRYTAEFQESTPAAHTAPVTGQPTTARKSGVNKRSSEGTPCMMSDALASFGSPRACNGHV